MNIIAIGYSGMQAAQMGMGVTAMNVANVGTIGYSRQGLLQSSIGPGYGGLSAGSGVQVDGIRRISDQFLINQVWQTNSNSGYYGMTSQYVSALEQIISGDSSSIGTGFNNFFSSLNGLTTDPTDLANRQEALNQANALASRFNDTNSYINSQQQQITSQTCAMVDQVNQLSGQIADYNKQISEDEAQGINTDTLRDQRDVAANSLSSLVDVDVTEDDDSNYSVSLKNGQPLVSGNTAGTLGISYDNNNNPTFDLQLGNSDFPVSPSMGGQMGALYDYQTGTLQQMSTDVNGMAQALATQFNAQLAQGFDLNGNPGKPLFTYDPTNPSGILQVNITDPKELALSDDPADPGNGNNLQALVALQDKKITIPGMGTMSLSDAAQSMVGVIGKASQQAESAWKSAKAANQQSLSQRNNVSGVNMDEEALNLQTYMQSYQANMKVIAAGNQIFSDLLDLF
ncbi:flagellar hook-associated protein FlgK [Enterobacter ludwigii]|uniref:flagellar hook-associated protein FlgK n=1 Tax=Enterobacter ludwigii TaxID=299767 RepID=UPI003F708842